MSVQVYSVQSLQNRFLLRRKESGLGRKVSDAALYGFNKPQDIEEMRPEKEPLVIEDDSIPPGDETTQDLCSFLAPTEAQGVSSVFSLSLSVMSVNVSSEQIQSIFNVPLKTISLSFFSPQLSLLETVGA